MFENLKVFEERYEALNGRLYDPAVVSDPKIYSQIRKEHKEIEPLVLKYREYTSCETTIKDLKDILEDSDSDKEFRDLAQMELSEETDRLAMLEEEIKILLIPKDPNDDKNVIVEIRSGAGGEEAALFASVLYRMYSMYAATKNWSSEMAAETNSCSRMDRIWERTIRAMPVQYVKPMAMMMDFRPEPITTISKITYSIMGMELTISTMRIIMLSTRPPK